MSQGIEKSDSQNGIPPEAALPALRELQNMPGSSLFTAMFTAAADPFFLHDACGTVFALNPAALEKFRVTREQALGLSLLYDFSPDTCDPEILRSRWKEASGETAVRTPNWKLKLPGGTAMIEVELFTTALVDNNTPFLLTRISDNSRTSRFLRDVTQLSRRFEDIALMSADWIWETDSEMRFIYVSDKAEQFLGLECRDLIGKRPGDILAPQEPASGAAAGADIRYANHEMVLGLEERYLTREGRPGISVTNAVPKFSAAGDFEGYIGIVKDISTRKESERQLILFEKVFEAALEGIIITDTKATIVAVNPAFTAITGYSKSEAVGKKPSFLRSDCHESSFYTDLMTSLVQDGKWSGEIWNRKKTGETFPEWLSLSAIVDENGKTLNYLGMFHDITEMKTKEQQIRFQALHDPLTGLPNRILFNDRLTMALRHSRRRGSKIAVLFFDLDNFKNVNDSLGHTAGDLVLKEASSRVSTVIRNEDTLARLGGDEFVILLEEAATEEYATLVAERIIRCFTDAYHVLGYEFFLTASIGIALSPDHGDDVDTIIRHADMAMYRAKDQGKNCYFSYTPTIEKLVSRRVTLESRMRKALEREEFYPVFQPRVNGDLSRVTGVEALVRWTDSGGNIVMPDQFVPVAEENGLIVPMDLMILRKACLLISPHIGNGHPELRLSVNLSSRHFGRKELVPAIQRTLEDTGFRPENLELEITETALMTEIETAIEKLGQLSAMGICITIDDFGTGYSSLYYLKKLPINVLKIDRSFTRDIITDQDDAEIVATIIAMAKTLKLKVVAEGVENSGQLEFLKLHGCDEYQGYLFSRPLPYPETAAFLGRSGPILFQS